MARGRGRPPRRRRELRRARRARRRGRWRAIAAAHAGGTALVVSHGAASRASWRACSGIGRAGMRAFRVPDNTGVTVVERDARRAWRLLVWNDAAHLRDAVLEALECVTRAPPLWSTVAPRKGRQMTRRGWFGVERCARCSLLALCGRASRRAGSGAHGRSAARATGRLAARRRRADGARARHRLREEREVRRGQGALPEGDRHQADARRRGPTSASPPRRPAIAPAPRTPTRARSSSTPGFAEAAQNLAALYLDDPAAPRRGDRRAQGRHRQEPGQRAALPEPRLRLRRSRATSTRAGKAYEAALAKGEDAQIRFAYGRAAASRRSSPRRPPSSSRRRSTRAKDDAPLLVTIGRLLGATKALRRLRAGLRPGHQDQGDGGRVVRAPRHLQARAQGRGRRPERTTRRP